MAVQAVRQRTGQMVVLSAAVGPVLGLGAASWADVDVLETVVAKDKAVGGVSDPSPLGAFAYDPINDRMLVAGFVGGDQQLRMVNNVSAGPAGQSTRVHIGRTAWLNFTRDGDLDNRGNGTPIVGGLLFNPQPITLNGVELPAYSYAFLADGNAVVNEGPDAIKKPEITQRLYGYNLGIDDNGDARDEFNSLATLADFQNAIGSTSTANSVIRQFAFSSDGSTIYVADSSSTYGGLWAVNVDGSNFRRIYDEPAGSDINAEPAVLQREGRDLVLVRGQAANGNEGGIDAYDTASGTVVPFLSATQVADFLETTTDEISTFSIATDADGNVYFNNTDSTSARGIFKLDTEGRLIKVVDYVQRDSEFGALATRNINPNTLRMQPRTATFTGPNGSFELTQLLYAEQGGVDTIAGAWVFAAGDFDRDNDLDGDDLASFLPKLTERGVAYATVESDAAFDLNGNGSVDWKDVKILQQFAEFEDGDANLDFAVDFLDLDLMEAAYTDETLPAVWSAGDFTGNDLVNFDDLLTIASTFDFTPTQEQIETRYAEGLFRTDVLRAFAIPEPGFGLVAMAGAIAGLARRRRA